MSPLRAALAAGLAVCGGLAGCGLLASGGTAEMQVTDAAAFAAAHTYRLAPSPGEQPGNGNGDDAAARMHATIEHNLEATLDKKGYHRVSGDAPADLRVQYRVAAVSRVERDADPAPKLAQLTTVGGNEPATGYEPLAGSSRSASVGQLVVYINDDKTGRVVWQGTAEAETVGAGMARNAAGRAAARLLRDVPGAAR